MFTHRLLALCYDLDCILLLFMQRHFFPGVRFFVVLSSLLRLLIYFSPTHPQTKNNNNKN